MSGRLVVVPTPIGNLEDITLRALRSLREADVVACEDTRVTGHLLRHFDIVAPKLVSYFAGNESGRAEQIVGMLREGLTVALVSDAGTPGVNDPGTRLVARAIEEGFPVDALPGPTAFVPALVASGLPTDAFVYEGFLPQKKGRQTRLRLLADESRTIILYESPHRIVRTLRDLRETLGGERRAAVVRELTKMFEEIVRGTLDDLSLDFASRSSIKGEFVVVVAGRSRRSGNTAGRGNGDEAMEE